MKYFNITNFRLHGHPFHLVHNSPWPRILGILLFGFLASQVLMWHDIKIFSISAENIWPYITQLSGLLLVWFVMRWFHRIGYEGATGYHTGFVQLGLRMGMLLFICSEVLFFFAFFWSFFHYTLSPSVYLGTQWPPYGALGDPISDSNKLDIWALPFTNTLLLLASGVAITVAHHSLTDGDEHENNSRIMGLHLTLLLGFTFLICQGVEYKGGISFSWRENVLGSIFFIATGFHGLHVTIGALFLTYCLFATTKPGKSIDHILTEFGRQIVNWRMRYIDRVISFDTVNFTVDGRRDYTPQHHFGFEAAAWYWHFVDVVWIILFLAVYAWGLQ